MNSMSLRMLEQPGEPAPDRYVGIPCRVRSMQVTLRPGGNLAACLFEAAAQAGYPSGAFALQGLPVRDLSYNLPSLYDGPERAAWFAGPFFGDEAVIEEGRVTIGLNDGAPMFHCHACWRLPDGTLCGGHLLLDRMTLAAQANVTFHGVSGAVFEVQPDEETGFPLFTPQPLENDGGTEHATTRPGLLAKVAPNIDFGQALAALVADHGFDEATILSGVGSFVGGTFDDGPAVPDPITEALIAGGKVVAAEGMSARIDAIATDPAAVVRRGQLTPGANAVGITFEVLLASG